MFQHSIEQQQNTSREHVQYKNNEKNKFPKQHRDVATSVPTSTQT